MAQTQTKSGTKFLALVATMGLVGGGLLVVMGLVVGLRGIDSPLDSTVSCGSAFFPDSSPDPSADGQVGSLESAGAELAGIGCPTARTNPLIVSIGFIGVGVMMFMGGALILAIDESGRA